MKWSYSTIKQIQLSIGELMRYMLVRFASGMADSDAVIVISHDSHKFMSLVLLRVGSSAMKWRFVYFYEHL